MPAAPLLSMYSLVVSDMEASVAFYKALGLGEDDRDAGAPPPLPGG